MTNFTFKKLPSLFFVSLGIQTYYLKISFCNDKQCKYDTNKRAKKGLKHLKQNEKLLHFVRHAEGLHNVVGEIDPNGYLLEENEDAALSQNGILQCLMFAQIEQKEQLVESSQLLVVSPQRRTLQTATYSFPHLIFRTPWIALENIRERTGAHPCDRRVTKTESQRHYPHINFNLIEHDHDSLYPLYPLSREPSSSVIQRGNEFLQFISTRQEQEIIVVTHSAFLEHLLDNVVDMHESEEIPIIRFKNCEMRSYIVDMSSKKAIRHHIS